MEINLGVIGKIIITKELEHIIDSLHSKVGKSEWSGPLFYKLKSGNLKDLKDLVFEANFMYPMDIGSTAETGFDWSGEMIDAYGINSDAINSSIGHIHSHHNMGAFYSGVDDAEVRKNAPNFNYYLTLIVDFTKTYKCKLAINSKINEFVFKGENGELLNYLNTKDEGVLMIGDLDIEIEGRENTLDWVSKRIETLKSIKSAQSSPKDFSQSSSNQTKNSKYSNNTNNFEVNSLSFLKAIFNMIDINDGENKSLWSMITEFANEDDMSIVNEDLVIIDSNVEFIYDDLFGDTDKNGLLMDDIIKTSISKLQSYVTLKNKLPMKRLITVLKSYTKDFAKSYNKNILSSYDDQY